MTRTIDRPTERFNKRRIISPIGVLARSKIVNHEYCSGGTVQLGLQQERHGAVQELIPQPTVLTYFDAQSVGEKAQASFASSSYKPGLTLGRARSKPLRDHWTEGLGSLSFDPPPEQTRRPRFGSTA